MDASKLKKLLAKEGVPWLIDTLNNPDFKHAGRYDWQNYVLESIQDIWNELSLESRVICAVMALARADLSMMLDDD